MEERPRPFARRPSFLVRHREKVVTAGLVGLTIALGVATADELLDLGLFPTRLEREARDLIARFAADEPTRREAAAKLVRDVDAFVAIPELIRALGSREARVRRLAAECLRKLARVEHGYDPDAPAAERRAAIARWRRWWRENEERF